MPKREKVPATRRPASPGQLGNIIARIAPLLTFTAEEAERITNDPEESKRFVGRMRRTLDEFRFSGSLSPKEVKDIIRWLRVYEKLFGKKPDFSGIHLPAKPDDMGPMRLIVVAQEILDWTGNRPLQGTLDALKKHFPCWQHESDLDEAIVKNDRDPREGSYAVWVRDVREADQANANKSANDLSAENHTSITVLERALLEMDCYLDHGEHLDRQSWTLCAGSRDRDGDAVPRAYWDVDKFCVSWCNPYGHSSDLRSRRVWV